MRSLLIFIFLVLISCSANAQKGYFGNRIVLSAGTSFAPPLLNIRNRLRNTQHGNDLRIESEWAALPPEARLGLDITLSKKVQFSLSGAWRGLQNTNIYSSVQNDDDPVSMFTYIDSFELKNNTLDLTASFKFFAKNARAPIGTYFELGGGISHVTSDVFPTYSIQEYNWVTKVETLHSDKRKPGVYTSNDYHIQLGVGCTQMLTRRLLIDYGARSSFIIGTYNFGPAYDAYEEPTYTYQDYFPDLIKFTQTTNLQSSYVLEIYLNLGFSL